MDAVCRVLCGSPAVANGVVYVASGNGSAYDMNALNAKTGSILWKYELGAEPTDPVVANSIVYFGATDSRLYAFGLPHYNAAPRPQSPTRYKSPARRPAH